MINADFNKTIITDVRVDLSKLKMRDDGIFDIGGGDD